jgi:hypothetical protein
VGNKLTRRKALTLLSVAGGVVLGLIYSKERITPLMEVMRIAMQPRPTPIPSLTPSITPTPAPTATETPIPTATPVSEVTIIPRSEWRAREPNHDAPNEYGFAEVVSDTNWYVYPEALIDAYNTVAIHHSAGILAANETMSDLQNMHMDGNGWADIGYHYGIDRDGLVYEGRPIQVRGASVSGFNTGTIGVVVMGNFQVEEPLPVQLQSLQLIVNWLAVNYQLTHLAGHGEFNNESVCPGRNMTKHLDDIAAAAALLRGTDGHLTPTPGPTTTPGKCC